MTVTWVGTVIMLAGVLAGSYGAARILLRPVRAYSWWPLVTAAVFIIAWTTGVYWAVWFGADRGWW